MLFVYRFMLFFKSFYAVFVLNMIDLQDPRHPSNQASPRYLESSVSGILPHMSESDISSAVPFESLGTDLLGKSMGGKQVDEEDIYNW